ncbi:MAG: hypothetical protein K0S67_729 [Nitrososphaeraceae archaeon]|jgi:hypothetical protein|nr:hypothetical protein [Nitrososphaeraceae archaeon]MDF2769387.1 hypothetical protein [Nitrososphaeraceae archaeon]
MLFFDKLSEILYNEIPETTSAYSKVMINIDQFNIGQSYVTAKVQNRYGNIININIEGGRNGIELQDELFNIKGKSLSVAYLITKIKDENNILVRKLPIIGRKDWLLIYDDTFFLMAVKDAYDEIEILAI